MKFRARGEGAFATEETLFYQPRSILLGQLENSSCVAACCRMLSGRDDIPEAYFRNLLGMTRKGVAPREASGAFAQVGIAAEYREGLSLDDLHELLKARQAIVSVTTQVTRGRHTIVIDGVEEDLALVRDPWPPPVGSSYKVSLQAFEEAWRPYRDAIILL